MKTPTFPKINSLVGRTLARLIAGNKITHRDFDGDTRSYRLSSYIEQLRNRHGWVIETVTEKALTNDPTGRTATYGRYQIDADILDEYRKLLGQERFRAFIVAVQGYENRALNDK